MAVENGVLKKVNEQDIEMLKENPNLFWNCVKRIDKSAFFYLRNLYELEIPSSVEYINPSFITDCMNLKKITIKGNLSSIKEYMFESYSDLETVELNNELEDIGDLAFYNCYNLRTISFRDSLSNIGVKSFHGCKSLEKVTLPRKITVIKENCFSECTSLKKVKFPVVLKRIEDSAFCNCSSLQEIVFGYRMKFIGENAFANCYNLTKVGFKNRNIDIKENSFKNCPLNYFIVTPKDNIILSKEEIFDIDNTYKCYNLNMIKNRLLGFDLSKLFDSKLDYEELSRLVRKLEKSKITMPFDFALELVKSNSSKNINLKYYKQLVPYFENESVENINIFCRFARGLGLFENEMLEKRVSKRGNEIVSRMDFAQRAGEFLKLMIENKVVTINSMNYNFKLINNDGFKEEYALFMMKNKNLEKLLKINYENNDFISKVYNYFEKVQLSHSNDKGSHKQLAPTIEKFVSYFKEDKFKSSENDKDISDELSKFYDDESLFEYAKEIKREYEEKDVAPNILSVNLEEKSLISINKYRDYIVRVSKKILKELTEVSNNNFTFEWLRKDDAVNFTLGKYCSCCSHLADIGDGVVRASVVHPDVQNLILRNKQGTIVAKSTLYINRKEGYGVFNNVEVSNLIKEEYKQEIYEKYKLAVKTFAEIYNKENEENPLKQINVGMRFNDLREQIIKDGMITLPQEAIHYKKYSKYNQYDGDSGETQFIVWKR